MKISINWLQDFIPSFSPNIASLVDQLTFSGLEVEDVASPTLPDERVVVGLVEDVQPHPDADRLKVCRVDVGSDEPLQIVCGASNVAQGMKVPVATIGSRLTTASGESFVIKKSKLRGQRSFGMICAADELGLGDDHSGIMVLDSSWQTGKPLASYLQSDTILDIAVTPNRPDVLSHLGIAREIAGIRGLTLPKAAEFDFNRSGTIVQIDDPESCPYYTAVVIRNVRVAESPSWLKDRLEGIGVRSKNNVVDITNYILHALGQPLHAFDLSKIHEERVVVRSDIGSEFRVINKESVVLQPGMPVICDSHKPVAVAGVMGGDDSSVSGATTDILLESAYFDSSAVRRSARLLGLSTDSSYRFERGTDPGNVAYASKVAVRMILDLCGGEVIAAEEAGSLPSPPPDVALRPLRANALLGTAIAEEKMISMLEHIGFRVSSRDGAAIIFAVPSFRVDVLQEIDLIEEVARLEGYNNIASSEKMVSSYPQARSFPEYFPDHLRSVMIALQFREVLTNPLMTRQEAQLFSSRCVAALNPISEGLEVLRPSLVPAMLKVVAHNIRHGNRDLRFFEIARAFRSGALDPSSTDPLNGFEEHEFLTFVLTGSRSPLNWSESAEKVDIFDMKGGVEMLLRKLNLLDKSSLNIYNDTTLSIDIDWMDGDKPCVLRAGTLTSAEQALLDAFDIDQPVFFAEIDLRVLEQCFSREVSYESPSRYPVVQRDLSFILPSVVTVKALLDCVRRSDDMIRSADVFDVFERETGDGSTERRVAVSIAMVDPSGTLKEDTISSIIQVVVGNAESELGAVIRQV
ncbi:phenylalanine--tRNA ligase subunit beta [Prosthecochloris sp. ZM]|uniref:phenylalanine--tRNA ligase subunit beta n=1 Tax=Prosthecochloris sp. ZM TaxID=2283143 RepID=UPI000DF753E5|nr:phenylalanine--tRNA ligase subunit beta [Prosthecochloris sp. ZM]RDD30631.1 phenylalanine--tRNA ligase subunit beta [Prosthecochloris sp. ZM]